jgi:hypothetical protein
VSPAINCSQGRCCSHVESVGIEFSGDVSRDFSAIDRRVEVMDRTQSSSMWHVFSAENYLEHAIIVMPTLHLPLIAHHSSRQIFVCWNFVIAVVERWIVGDGLRQLKIDQASA